MPARCNPFVHFLFALFGVGELHRTRAGISTRPVRIVVPFPPGGGTDVFARIMGQRLISHWVSRCSWTIEQARAEHRHRAGREKSAGRPHIAIHDHRRR